MFNYFKRDAEVLDHWVSFAENFQVPSSEVYDAILAELKERQVPDLDVDRIEFAEGGPLSPKRVYLRMMRESLVFDVCAAPFGAGSFFSCRTAVIKREASLLVLGILAAICAAVGYVVLHVFSIILGSIVVGAVAEAFLFLLILHVLRNANVLGFQSLDTFLFRLPLFGPVYEQFLRKETYYRHDSRLCYVNVVKDVVKKQADRAIAANGVQMTKQYERAPILGELYKPVYSSNSGDGPVLSSDRPGA